MPKSSKPFIIRGKFIGEQGRIHRLNWLYDKLSIEQGRAKKARAKAKAHEAYRREGYHQPTTAGVRVPNYVEAYGMLQTGEAKNLFTQGGTFSKKKAVERITKLYNESKGSFLVPNVNDINEGTTVTRHVDDFMRTRFAAIKHLEGKYDVDVYDIRKHLVSFSLMEIERKVDPEIHRRMPMDPIVSPLLSDDAVEAALERFRTKKVTVSDGQLQVARDTRHARFGDKNMQYISPRLPTSSGDMVTPRMAQSMRNSGRHGKTLPISYIKRSTRVIPGSYLLVKKKPYYVIDSNTYIDLDTSRVTKAPEVFANVNDIAQLKKVGPTAPQVVSRMNTYKAEFIGGKYIGPRGTRGTVVLDIETPYTGIRGPEDILTVGLSIRDPVRRGQVTKARGVEVIGRKTFLDGIRGDMPLKSGNLPQEMREIASNEMLYEYMVNEYGDIDQRQHMREEFIQEQVARRSKKGRFAATDVAAREHAHYGTASGDKQFMHRLERIVSTPGLNMSDRVDNAISSMYEFIGDRYSDLPSSVQHEMYKEALTDKKFRAIVDKVVNTAHKEGKITRNQLLERFGNELTDIDNVLKEKVTKYVHPDGTLKGTSFTKDVEELLGIKNVDDIYYTPKAAQEVADKFAKVYSNITSPVVELDMNKATELAVDKHIMEPILQRKTGASYGNYDTQTGKFSMDYSQIKADLPNEYNKIMTLRNNAIKGMKHDALKYGQLRTKMDPKTGKPMLTRDADDFMIALVNDSHKGNMLNKLIGDRDVYTWGMYDDQMQDVLNMGRRQFKDIRGLGLLRMNQLFDVDRKMLHRLVNSKSNRVINAFRMTGYEERMFSAAFANFDTAYMKGTDVETMFKLAMGDQAMLYSEKHWGMMDSIDTRKIGEFLSEGKMSGLDMTIEEMTTNLKSPDYVIRGEAFKQYNMAIERFTKSLAVKHLEGKIGTNLNIDRLNKEFGLDIDGSKFTGDIEQKRRYVKKQLVDKIQKAFGQGDIDDIKLIKGLAQQKGVPARAFPERMSAGKMIASVALLSVGTSYLTRFRSMMFEDEKEIIQEEVRDGLPHSSTYTMLRRLNFTDFSSGRRKWNPVTTTKNYEMQEHYGGQRAIDHPKVPKVGLASYISSKQGLTTRETFHAQDRAFENRKATGVEAVASYGEGYQHTEYIDMRSVGLDSKLSYGETLFGQTFGPNNMAGIRGNVSDGSIARSDMMMIQKYQMTDFGSRYDWLSKATTKLLESAQNFVLGFGPGGKAVADNVRKLAGEVATLGKQGTVTAQSGSMTVTALSDKVMQIADKALDHSRDIVGKVSNKLHQLNHGNEITKYLADDLRTTGKSAKSLILSNTKGIVQQQSAKHAARVKSMLSTPTREKIRKFADKFKFKPKELILKAKDRTKVIGSGKSIPKPRADNQMLTQISTVAVTGSTVAGTQGANYVADSSKVYGTAVSTGMLPNNTTATAIPLDRVTPRAHHQRNQATKASPDQVTKMGQNVYSLKQTPVNEAIPLGHYNKKTMVRAGEYVDSIGGGNSYPTTVTGAITSNGGIDFRPTIGSISGIDKNLLKMGHEPNFSGTRDWFDVTQNINERAIKAGFNTQRHSNTYNGSMLIGKDGMPGFAQYNAA